jgi:hypothetical protein
MSRAIVNLMAVLVISLGAMSYSFAIPPQVEVEKNTCSGGGATCSCVGSCIATANGCGCA